MFEKIKDCRDLRLRLGMNQFDFWGMVGTTQSGGSRYENGRDMPKPVRELVRLVHLEQIDLQTISRQDFEIVAYLKQHERTLYAQLKKSAKKLSRKDHS